MSKTKTTGEDSISEMADLVTIGLSEASMRLISVLSGEGGLFAQEIDAYRFAIALALAHCIDPEQVSIEKRQTKYNVGSLDPDRKIWEAIRTLSDTSDLPPYRKAERLAEWGVQDLHSRFRSGQSIRSLVDELETL